MLVGADCCSFVLGPTENPASIAAVLLTVIPQAPFSVAFTHVICELNNSMVINSLWQSRRNHLRLFRQAFGSPVTLTLCHKRRFGGRRRRRRFGSLLVISSYCCLQWPDHKQWSLISSGLKPDQQLHGMPQKKLNHHCSEIAESVWYSTKSDLAGYVELTGSASFIWYGKEFSKCSPLFWYDLVTFFHYSSSTPGDFIENHQPENLVASYLSQWYSN